MLRSSPVSTARIVIVDPGGAGSCWLRNARYLPSGDQLGRLLTAAICWLAGEGLSMTRPVFVSSVATKTSLISVLSP
jgi:hypothetical protein